MSNGRGLMTLYSVVGFELTSSVPSVIKDSVIHSLTAGESSIDSNFSTTIKQHNSASSASKNQLATIPSILFLRLP